MRTPAAGRPHRERLEGPLRQTCAWGPAPQTPFPGGHTCPTLAPAPSTPGGLGCPRPPPGHSWHCPAGVSPGGRFSQRRPRGGQQPQKPLRSSWFLLSQDPSSAPTLESSGSQRFSLGLIPHPPHGHSPCKKPLPVSQPNARSYYWGVRDEGVPQVTDPQGLRSKGLASRASLYSPQLSGAENTDEGRGWEREPQSLEEKVTAQPPGEGSRPGAPGAFPSDSVPPASCRSARKSDPDRARSPAPEPGKGAGSRPRRTPSSPHRCVAGDGGDQRRPSPSEHPPAAAPAPPAPGNLEGERSCWQSPPSPPPRDSACLPRPGPRSALSRVVSGAAGTRVPSLEPPPPPAHATALVAQGGRGEGRELRGQPGGAPWDPSSPPLPDRSSTWSGLRREPLQRPARAPSRSGSDLSSSSSSSSAPPPPAPPCAPYRPLSMTRGRTQAPSGSPPGSWFAGARRGGRLRRELGSEGREPGASTAAAAAASGAGRARARRSARRLQERAGTAPLSEPSAGRAAAAPQPPARLPVRLRASGPGAESFGRPSSSQSDRRAGGRAGTAGPNSAPSPAGSPHSLPPSFLHLPHPSRPPELS
ncbi:basic salivary proline-rich protein 1-like [Antechinus flavipes]|uniref:basic salivary proline-rich protein 1-like n=1 Tax=Antechinus flavipes TaxID=38775 RepID=UPI00223546AD|nr:basic salivary proline-rich protein 1-like [Antechinus flavipes]